MSALSTSEPKPGRAVASATEIWEFKGTKIAVCHGVGGASLESGAHDVKAVVQDHIKGEGAILLRGFRKPGVSGFYTFARSFGHELVSYEFASTPRRKIAAGVYSSTEYPAHQWIPQHNEQAYTRHWPMKIWFYCDVAAAQGGQTPVMDSREVYRRVPARIREVLTTKGLMYVRNYGNELDLPWQEVFETKDRAAVEQFCRGHDISWEWLDDGRLRTRQICQAVAKHPVSGEDLWFNQAHLFHVSALAPDIREILLDTIDEVDLPRNVYFADGSPIDGGLLDEVRSVYLDGLFAFPWQEGDVMMLDNMLVSHGRAPFKGSRRVLVAMAETYPQ